MPCQTYWPSDRDEHSGNVFAINQIKQIADAATRAACDLRTILRRGGNEYDLCQETREWIKQHDEEERVRIAQEEARGERERVRREALNKLTLDERRALGL